jgi:integrase
MRLYIILGLATAARDRAVRNLTWDRVDCERRTIDLRLPDLVAPHKGRAIVPINGALQTALLEARPAAMTNLKEY